MSRKFMAMRRIAHMAQNRYIFLIVIAFSFVSLNGCQPMTVITAYTSTTPGNEGFSADYKRCMFDQTYTDRTSGLPITPPPVAECLKENEWRPVLQFAAFQAKDQSDLAQAISACRNSLTVEGKNDIQGSISKSAADLASAWRVNRTAFYGFSECISSTGWQVIPELPWLDIDEHQVIPPFTSAKIEKPVSLVRDESLAIYWAADIVEKGAPQPYSAAVASIEEMNNRRHGGRSDWRIPTEKELRAIGRSMRGIPSARQGSGNQISNTAIQQPVPFWTASDERQGPPVAVRIADGKTFSLPDEGPYAAHLLPVAGIGWGKSSRIASSDMSEIVLYGDPSSTTSMMMR